MRGEWRRWAVMSQSKSALSADWSWSVVYYETEQEAMAAYKTMMPSDGEQEGGWGPMQYRNITVAQVKGFTR